MNNLDDLLKNLEYYDYKCESNYRKLNTDSYLIVFLNKEERKVINLELTGLFVKMATPKQIIEQIDNMMENHEEFRKLKHHKQFYNKFDEMLHEDS